MILVLALGWTVAHAEPAADPTLRLTAQHLRRQEAPVFLGVSDRSPLALAHQLRAVGGPPGVLADQLAPEWAAVTGQEDWTARLALRPGGRLAVGSQRSTYRQGDLEPGLLSARLWGDVRMYPGIAELSARPELTLDVGEVVSLGDDAHIGGGMGIAMRELWVGLRTEHVSAGAGLRGRWIGPGRHGSLLLTNHARPAPMASGSAQTPPLGRLGRLRMEVGAGWLNAPRSDVNHPGWLMMDFRWLPIPYVEVGIARVGIFGGEGRPTPPLGQLILPTDPHVYDDPDQLLPDQDELAAADVRATVPLRGLDGYVEGYWQYGGEDMIVRRLPGNIPYPALAGIGNLYGAALNASAWTLNVELTRVLDDYFRWYTGHRVYHDGLTQDGLSMAYAPGGDSHGLWGAVTWLEGEWGGQLYVEQVNRVGVVESLGDNLLALSSEERRRQIGVVGWRAHAQRSWWRVELSVEHIDGVNFVVGHEATVWRLAIGR